MFICMYVYMYVCMHVCTKSFLKTTTNSSCVCTHLANKADSDSDSDSDMRLPRETSDTICNIFKSCLEEAQCLNGLCLIGLSHLSQMFLLKFQKRKKMRQECKL